MGPPFPLASAVGATGAGGGCPARPVRCVSQNFIADGVCLGDGHWSRPKQRYVGFPVRLLPWETGCQVVIRLAVLFATQMGVTFGSEAQS
jgi:hypothetical protein